MKKRYFFLALIIFCSCKKYHETEVDVPGNFDFNITDSAGIANDGRSALTLHMTKTLTAKPALKVIFSTNKGILSADNLIFTGDAANSFLKVSQDTGFYLVKGMVKDGDSILFQKTISFSLIRALPDSAYMEPNRTISRMGADTPTIIRTFLKRETGLVTIGTYLSFRSYQLSLTNDTVPVGRFEGLFNNYSKADETLNDIKFYSDTRNIDSNRVVTIEAKTLGRNGLPLIRRLSLRYK